MLVTLSKEKKCHFENNIDMNGVESCTHIKVLIILGWLSVSVCAGVSTAPVSQPFETLICLFVALL